jgi:purine nucleosidase
MNTKNIPFQTIDWSSIPKTEHTGETGIAYWQTKRSISEASVLGDNPLVVLTALQSSWEVDPSSSRYVTKKAPTITDSGLYDETSENRNIRVYTNLDTRLMIEDFIAKLALMNRKK